MTKQPFTYVYKFSFKENGIWQEEYYSDPADAEQHRFLRVRAQLWGNDLSEISEIQTVTVWHKEAATA
jgi:hypothetical protein